MLSPKAIGKSPSVLLLASRGSKHSLVHSCITAFCLHLLSSSLCIYVSSLLIRMLVIRFRVHCNPESVQLLSHVRLFVTPMGCSPPGSSVHGILQTRILEGVAISYELY